jgi:FKBP-type peptidyl-prolyl cis-trans isomerase
MSNKNELEAKENVARIRSASFQEIEPKELMVKLDVLNADRLKAERVSVQAVNELLSRVVYLEAQNAILKDLVPNFEEKVSLKLDQIHNRRNLGMEEPVELYDAVTVNFTGYNENNEPSPEMSVRDHYFVLTLKNFIPDLEKQFLGMKMGEKKRVNATFPEEYPMKPEVAGKTFVFELEMLHAKRNLDIEKERQNGSKS